MRIRLTRDNLLNQLPDGELPEEIILEGDEVGIQVDPWVERFPEEHAYLSAIEWKMFKRMAEGPAHFKSLAVYSKPRNLEFSNIVAVHMVTIRKKLAHHQSRWAIVTRAGFGVYELVSKV